MDKEWYYLTNNNEEVGPFTIDEICNKLENSDIPVDMPLKKQNEPGWTTANKHPDFQIIQLENTPDDSVNIEKDDKYKRVGGWLLFFIFGMCIFIPILNFYVVYEIVDMINNYNLQSNMNVLFITTIIIILGFIVYSFITGYKLFRIVPGAVGFAKVFLIVSVILNLLITLLPYAFGIDTEIANEISKSGIRDIIKSAIYAIIWYTYFVKSKRVSITYDFVKAP